MSRELCMSIPTAANCVALVKNTVAQLPVGKSRGAERLSPGALLTKPDPSSTWAAQIERTAEDLLLHGRATWVILAWDGEATERNPRGFPVRARYVPAEQVTQHLSDDWGAYDRVTHYTVGATDLAPDRVIHFDAGHSGVLTYGAKSLRAAVELEAAAARFATVDLPVGVLKNEGAQLGPDEALALVETFTEARRRNSIAFLQGVEFETSPIDAAGLQLVEARATAAVEISRLFSVPVSMVSASPTGGASAMLYANLATQFAAFIRQAVAPVIIAIEAALSDDAVTAHGQAVTLDTQSFLRSDPTASMEFVTGLLAGEVISPDEARSFLGIPPSPGGPANLIPGVI